jgi:hypothetical protein
LARDPGRIPSAERDDSHLRFVTATELSPAHGRTLGDTGGVVSRDLPRRPSLAHLKKQAKELLESLRRQTPNATLVDAQHALAREYGFASWPKLKAHVESAAATEPRQLSFHRFTYKARQALFFARFEAAQAGSLAIEPEHMLLGLLRASQNVPRTVFTGAPISIERARARVAGEAAAPPLPATVMIPFDGDTRLALDAAIEEADALRHQRIGLAHLVLGILHDGESEASALLHDAGLRIDMVRHVAAASVDHEPEG